MLHKHLIAHPRPRALPENIVRWNKYRVTVLGDRLFRLEQSEDGVFRDGATQSVWYRDMPQQTFSVTASGKSFRIATSACTLILKERREDCRILLDGKKLRIGNSGNLLGTARTLDNCDGEMYVDPVTQQRKKLSLGTGVCSQTGVAVLEDAASLTLGESGEVLPERGHGSDEYIFAFGHDYRGAVRALFSITGNVPMLPRFAFGNWWSRYYPYSDREYLAVLAKFEERRVPLTVATVDMDWHYSDDVDVRFGVTAKGRNTPFYGGNNGWTGYSWNKELFPDRRMFLKKVHDRGLKVTLNLHPADGVRWWEDAYPAMAAAMGIDPASCEAVRFNMADTNFINNYFDLLHRPYEADGVDFWWVDWQQGTASAMDGLDPLWSLNHYHTLDHAKDHVVPLLLSRFCGIGSHRYCVGFSGDTYITRDTLKYLPYFTATASNAGYPWWSHDIGGHQKGETDGELYLRNVQFGVFSPVCRLHCMREPTVTKEPWAYGNGTGVIAMDYLRLRHRMIPFLYTMAYRTHTQGRALVEPLYYEWDDRQAYRYRNEYLFGGLLVAPVTNKLQKDGYARIKVWIPEGRWTDVFTRDGYTMSEGGGEKTLLRKLEHIPVLAKAGTVIPLSGDEGNGTQNPENLRVLCYAGNGGFTLFEDGAGGAFFTEFRMEESESGGQCVQKLFISSHGDASVVPDGRVLRIRFENIENGELTLTADGKSVPVGRADAEIAAADIAFAAGKTYCLSVRYRVPDALRAWLYRAVRELSRSEGGFCEKKSLRRALEGAQTLEECVAAVKASPLLNGVKERLLETLCK